MKMIVTIWRLNKMIEQHNKDTMTKRQKRMLPQKWKNILIYVIPALMMIIGGGLVGS